MVKGFVLLHLVKGFVLLHLFKGLLRVLFYCICSRVWLRGLFKGFVHGFVATLIRCPLPEGGHPTSSNPLDNGCQYRTYIPDLRSFVATGVIKHLDICRGLDIEK